MSTNHAIALASREDNASYWDTTITKHGNKYWRRLQEPSLARLLGPSLSSKPGGGRGGNKKALDLATGNGLCARWLARHGAHSVLATDGTENMLALARAHCSEDDDDDEPGSTAGVKIGFRKVDVTSAGDLEKLGREEGRFDVVLMNMAVMDVADLEPLARALRGLLADGGVFVATLLHPVFFTSNATRNFNVGYSPVNGEYEVVRSKVITEYMSVLPAVGIALPGQPVKQIYFHRPMHELFATFFKAGLVMDAMEELAFTEEDAEEKIESNSNYTQLPAILAFRMRFPSGTTRV
ncbi:ribosomal protein L11 methyltransferase [Chaetomidium leptoderma]|uniref:Ribosomal protein L11 methyltransferase n=1 Tax=Chaetomidium leptoderma TaxID=669021 RepID=A0AAN6VML9_9PEZI|nr:ribosomal protein L11 methyltransferase [Chaetomidium leptoderma]